MARPIHSIAYYGGKSLMGRHGKVTRYIIETLPKLPGYLEPFGGMLGVLLARPRVQREIVNDLDGRVMNWWRCVQADEDRIAHLVSHAPKSRVAFRHARSVLDERRCPPMDEPPDFGLAWAFFIVVRDSPFHGPEQRTFTPQIAPGSGNSGTPQIRRMADRLRRVQLEHMDAAELLRKIAPRDDYAVYCDPPYGAGANTSPYGADISDKDAFVEALKAQRGAVIITGYGDDWDCLGWTRREFPTKVVLADGRTPERTEVVWSNFQPAPGLFP